MKSFFPFLLFSLIPFTTYAQVPNGGFENWVLINGLEEPEHWTTNNSACCISIEKVETDAIEGTYSMKVSSNAPSIEGSLPGHAEITFSPDQLYQSLQASLRIDSVDMGEVFINVLEWRNDQFEPIGSWTNEEKTNGVIQISIPIQQTLMDSLKIQIIAANTLTPLGSEGYSEVIIDNLMPSGLTATGELEGMAAAFQVYPNPSRGLFFLNSINGDDIHTISCYDLNGKLVQVKQGANYVDLSTLPKGAYLLVIRTGMDAFYGQLIRKN